MAGAGACRVTALPTFGNTRDRVPEAEKAILDNIFLEVCEIRRDLIRGETPLTELCATLEKHIAKTIPKATYADPFAVSYLSEALRNLDLAAKATDAEDRLDFRIIAMEAIDWFMRAIAS